MSRFKIIALLAVLSITLWPGVLPAAAPAAKDKPPAATKVAPKAFFPDSSYNFGEVMERTKITHDFYVENRGNAPLVIKNIRPD